MLSSMAATSGEADAVVAITVLLADGDEPRVDQLGQMLAGGRARDARQVCELAAGQGLPAHQRAQHRGARRVADERRDLDQIGGSDHGQSLTPSRRGPQATTIRHAPNFCRATRRRTAATVGGMSGEAMEDDMKRVPLRVEPFSTWLERRRKGPIFPVIVA